MNTNIFSHERQWIQLATILLIAAFTESWSKVLLKIIYWDLNLFAQRDKIIEKVTLILQLKLIRIKFHKRCKRSWVTVRKLSSSIWLVYSKIYIFFIDTNSFFCVIFHIISLVCYNDVYLTFDLTFKKVLMLSVWKRLNCQLISWKENMHRLIASSWVIEIESSFRLVKTWFESEFLTWVFEFSQKIQLN